MKTLKGFTLIELLIVVAIIAILAAIAVPNFLEAQTRSKVSRAKADMRSLATALEAYAVDYNNYPPPITDVLGLKSRSGANIHDGFVENIFELSTPVAYMSSTTLIDPFVQQRSIEKFKAIFGGSVSWLPPDDWQGSYYYVSYSGWWGTQVLSSYTGAGGVLSGQKGFAMGSFGPDQGPGPMGADWLPVLYKDGNLALAYSGVYDPTNGTVSWGDIVRYGGSVDFPLGK